MRTETEQQDLTEKYEKLLQAVSTISPALATRIHETWEQDRKDFIEAVQAETSTKTRQDWAKNSCNKCHGRGTVGTRDGEVLYCSCTTKNYKKWLSNFRFEYNKQKGR